MENKILPLYLLVCCTAFVFCVKKQTNLPPVEPVDLKVMTWNIWGRLNQDSRYFIEGKSARARMIEILQESEADVITMTEAYGSAAEIAEHLKYHYYTPSANANLAIFSRFPLHNYGTPEGLSPFSFIAATAQLPNGKKIRIYNLWLTSGGRHIVEIKNPAISDTAFAAGDLNRFEHIQELLQHPKFLEDLALKDHIPILVGGDFNCVSHLDYTEKTKEKGLNYSRKLDIQTSIAMMKMGFIDSYRSIHPQITKKNLGYTWTTVGLGYIYESGKGFVPVENNHSPEYRDPYARIDYIYSTGEKLVPVASETILHHPLYPNRSFPEFPSDHGAVLTVFRLR